ncbi:hypothetical protein, partial [Escherichia coli]|uniref:hypothetical protein n=1 Tax=Escherichia coli TaxID=562 RepID=UPI001BC9BFBF
TNRPLTDFGGKTSIFSHPVYLFLREFSLQDFRGGSGSYRLLFYYSHLPSSVLTNNSGINERWQTSLIQHQKSKNYSAIQQ